MTTMPGVEMLRQWLTEQGVTPHRFAIDNRLDPSELNKLLRGRRGGVSIEFAARVEDATGGGVPIRAWIPKKNGA